MKDELEDLVMDESTRKTATDWLMQVISGKRPTNGHSDNGAEHDGSERSDGLVISGSAVAIEDMPPAADTQGEESARAATMAFSAEDLCGAPAVPLIKVTPKDEITADDVCWVPEEMRLKPQPPAAEQPASNLHVMQPREALDFRKPGGLRDPELTYLTGPADPSVTAADISREAAPYMVEPTWNGVDSRPETSEVSATDVMRDSVRNYTPAPNGSDLPTSFRVIRSAAPVVEAAAPVVESAAPVIEAAVPVVEAAVPVVEAAAPVVEAPAPVVEAAAPAVVEVPVPAIGASEPVVEVAAPVVEAAASVVETPSPVVEAAAPAAEVAETLPEQDEADAHEIEAALAHPEDFSARQIPGELEPAAQDAGEAGVKASENVFAREGFWGGAAGSEPEGEVPSKAILRGMKRAYTAASESPDFEKHPEGWFSAWKTMLRLGSVLPWVARALPALESGALGVEPGSTNPPGAPAATGVTGVAQETRQDVAGLRLVQYEIRTTVQDHSMQLKRVEEQLTRVRESMDSRSSENAEVAENLRAMTKLMRLAGMGLGVLLLVLIVLVIVMLAHR